MKLQRVLWVLPLSLIWASCKPNVRAKEADAKQATPAKSATPLPTSSQDNKRDWIQSSPDLDEKSLKRKLEEVRKERAKLMHRFHDLSPKQDTALADQAIAAFSKQGLSVEGVTVFIRRPGCTVEVQQSGRKYRQELKTFDKCRLGELRKSGKPQIWKVPEGRKRGILIVDIKENNEDARCTTQVKTLRFTAKGPRISKSIFSSLTCSFDGFGSIVYGLLSLEDAEMPKI